MVPAKDEMVQHEAIERLDGGGEAPRRAPVAFAWGRVSARVIVGDEDRRTSACRSVGNDCSQREIGPVLVPFVPRQAQAAAAVIQVSDKNSFPRWIRLCEAARKEDAGRGKAVELQRGLGTLAVHAKSLGHRRRSAEEKRVYFGDVMIRFGETRLAVPALTWQSKKKLSISNKLLLNCNS